MTEHPLHATCVAFDGRGVLLSGPSGSGKSDLALRLLDRGWSLVADDYVNLAAMDGQLIASAPANIAGRMEVRHVGLLATPSVSGIPVCLVIELGKEPERLPEIGIWTQAGLAIPALALNALEASAPLKVEHSLRVFGLALE